jgi:hypothetical protein
MTAIERLPTAGMLRFLASRRRWCKQCSYWAYTSMHVRIWAPFPSSCAASLPLSSCSLDIHASVTVRNEMSRMMAPRLLDLRFQLVVLPDLLFACNVPQLLNLLPFLCDNIIQAYMRAHIMRAPVLWRSVAP